MLVDPAEAEHLAQGGHGALGSEGAGRGQLRLRVDDAGGDQGDGKVTPARGLPGEQGVEAELLERAKHSGDMAVGHAADAGEGLLGIDQRFTAEDTPHGLDGRVREFGEVGERAFFDAAAIAVGLAEQDGGWG